MDTVRGLTPPGAFLVPNPGRALNSGSICPELRVTRLECGCGLPKHHYRRFVGGEGLSASYGQGLANWLESLFRQRCLSSTNAIFWPQLWSTFSPCRRGVRYHQTHDGSTQQCTESPGEAAVFDVPLIQSHHATRADVWSRRAHSSRERLCRLLAGWKLHLPEGGPERARAHSGQPEIWLRQVRS
jgi:hypothetical protein